MAVIQTRSSVLSIMQEVTEGTPVIPSGATDFVALQDDFTMEPSFEVLENAELKSSIGRAKSILGAESPTVSMSHYIRASGVVGQAPNYGLLLKAAFGNVAIASTEYDTVAGSTVGVVNVDTGEGVNFQRGQALLIKDPTNGYSIRCLDSVSADALSLGFQLPVAPGTGVNLGRAVTYLPANSNHPTLTMWHYLGSGGAVQMVAGARVVSASVDITAGDLINASFDLEGLAFYWDPINILAADRFLDFTDDDGTFAASVTAKMYKDPYELAAALQQAMNDTASTETYTVVYQDSNGKFKITSTSTVLSLLWNTGTNAANTIGDKIGFLTAADDTGSAGSVGYTSDNAQSFAPPYTPTFDNSDPLAAKDNVFMLGNADDYACFQANSVSMSIATPKTDILSICAVSGKSGSVINSREVTIEVSGPLDQYQVEKFKSFRSGDEVKAQYSFGTKIGGNWVPGKCGAMYSPSCTISSFNIDDNDGLAQLNMTLTAFVNSAGEGEVYFNFL